VCCARQCAIDADCCTGQTCSNGLCG
jgi:hypothetical protein